MKKNLLALSLKTIFKRVSVTLFAGFLFSDSTVNSQTTFGYTGTNQTYTVPAGVTAVRIYMWGAGGGGGDATQSAITHGGGGGYVEGTLCVTPGENLTVIVGAGGKQGSAANIATYGGGGAGGSNNNIYYTGSGGGRSAIRRSNIELATAGGGGGGGETRNYSGNDAKGGVGGGGGGTTGRDGANYGYLSYTGGAGGKGGTQTAGGAGGNGGYGNGGNGAAFQGGNGQSLNGRAGGGGGGGYYGGGGGGGRTNNTGSGGGGGGSSYIGGLSDASTTAGGAGSLPNNSQQVAGNASHPYNSGSYGRGGNANSAGQNGRIVIVPITVDAGPDLTICSGEQVVINGTGISTIYNNNTTSTLPSYCAVSSSNNDNTGIVRVVFNTIDNNAGGSNSAYQDKTSISTNVTPNSTHTLQVWVETAGTWTVHTRAWIDWNKDGDFSDSGEEYILGSNSNTSNGATPTSPSITIPSSAAGSYRLRIRTTYNMDPVSCGAQDYTETEDYTINVLTPVPISYSWSGGPIVSGANTLTPTVNPTVNPTVYTLSASVGGCTVTDNVTVHVQTPPGDPSVFGSNTWNVYGFNDNGVYNSAVSLNGVYTGYYTQNRDVPADYGVNTEDIANAGWAASGNPSTSSTWQGCTLPDNHYTFVHKRRGFPCGTYELTFNKWDDATQIYLNGNTVPVWNCPDWNGAGTCNGYVGVYELDANSTIEIRTAEGTGDALLSLTIKPVISTLSGNESRTCYVAANSGWNTFTVGDGRLLVSIDPGASTLGNVAVTSYVSSPFLVNACAPLYNPSHETAVLGRRWTINPANQPTNSVRVRLYFDQSEHTALVPLAAASSSIDDQTSVYSDLRLSKYHHPLNTAVDGDFNNNCAHIPSGQMTIWNPVGANTISSLFSGFDANGRYTEYVITPPAFSEFWLHGSQNSSPLAVNLENFSASCEGNSIGVEWKTTSEQNSDYFTLERSRDGYNWTAIATIKGAGTTNSSNNYAITDNAGSEVYYRLKQVDFDGSTETFGPIAVNCENKTNELTVYPNPNNGTFTVAVSTAEAMGESTIIVQDLNGKITASRELNVLSGTNTVHFEGEHLVKGTYIVSIKGVNNLFIPVKLIIQ